MHAARLVAVLGLAAAMIAPATAASAMAPPARRLDPDAAFLRTAHQGNLAQIRLGRIAAHKAADPRIRELGARFAADSVHLDAAVRDVAAALHVELDTAPNSTVQQGIALYQATSRTDFDEVFLTSQATLHAQAARLIRTELADGDEAEVQQIARGALPIIKRHRAALRRAGRD
ncbi:hypothetical protein GCM10010168_08900 [Actinoplanes ianthinogenes]|uniref:DUF4142 domain-containing protein n=1 Tax=Actinoplanes ianthinogenes TaxID=122358 RepID=A0ABN6CEY1_9ACTN|nr:DUF4142 domain-containing protein [Actinoplanes ianthinogenes]BCJ44077.1 hypothetical protein Aiant_47340 [Actinoplanes ianthinogenes]GGQ95618.1 hypothetical protein GCM10010168_08900 [Actinoplanes ianthinogenes]